jgi:hypothetical protein
MSQPEPRPGANAQSEPTSAVELRIHGVRGATPADILDDASQPRVAGDSLAGFFRSGGVAPSGHQDGITREAFAWGNLTAGSASRAFWLLLLPFMLTNIAYWMRPRRSDGDLPRAHRAVNRLYDVVVRLLALGLTVLITLAASGVGMDLVGWQCSGQGEQCAQVWPRLAHLADPASPFAAPGVGLVVGALLPLVVVTVLWGLSRRTGERYEALPWSGTEAREGHAAGSAIVDREAALAHPAFWDGHRLFGRLRSAHIALAFCTVAALLALPAMVAGPSALAAVGALLLAAIAGTAVLSAACACWADPPPAARGLSDGWAQSRVGRLLTVVDRALRGERLAAGLRVAAVMAVPLAAGYALWPRPGWEISGALPGFAALLHGVLAALSALGALLFLLAFLLHRGAGRPRHVAMRGLAGPATAALGVLLGGAFSAAVGTQSALWLERCAPSAVGEAACVRMQAPTAYTWLQLAFTVEVGIAVVAAGVLLLVMVRRSAGTAGIAEEYGERPWPERDRGISRARALGAMTETLPSVLVWLILPAVALAGLSAYSVVANRFPPLHPNPEQAMTPQSLSGVLGAWAVSGTGVLVAFGSVLAGAFLAALLWLGRSAYRDRPTREAVGMLWDVGTFWPRGAHPLAPPCYSERAVPQLVTRIRWLASLGRPVVLSGHSQGSVLAAAALWQVPENESVRVGLLTHGSPLYRLYARYFPAFFGPRALADLHGRAAAWRNLWRRTDAIAGPIRLSQGMVEPKDPLPDPAAYRREKGEAIACEIQGHSHYTREPGYTTALRDVAGAAGWEPADHQGP